VSETSAPAVSAAATTAGIERRVGAQQHPTAAVGLLDAAHGPQSVGTSRLRPGRTDRSLPQPPRHDHRRGVGRAGGVWVEHPAHPAVPAAARCRRWGLRRRPSPRPRGHLQPRVRALVGGHAQMRHLPASAARPPRPTPASAPAQPATGGSARRRSPRSSSQACERVASTTCPSLRYGLTFDKSNLPATQGHSRVTARSPHQPHSVDPGLALLGPVGQRGLSDVGREGSHARAVRIHDEQAGRGVHDVLAVR
jgi:hypothetical protein